MKNSFIRKVFLVLTLVWALIVFASCKVNINEVIPAETETTVVEETEPSVLYNPLWSEEKIYLDMNFPYATYSVINDGFAVLYKQDSRYVNYKDKVIAVNAGHGTKGGSKLKTYSHPDFTPKVSDGSTMKGAVMSTAVSVGMTFENGVTEAEVNLMVAERLRDKLLNDGYSVLMIRTGEDVQLDNIARTVIANMYADAHVAIHFDTTHSDKGIFFITPYNNKTYLSMEPLKSNADNIRKFGRAIIAVFNEMGEKVWKGKGELQLDLTQMSYSTNPSVDIELGDVKTVITDEKLDIFAEGIKRGIDRYFTS